MHFQVRQGDVLIERIASLPAQLTPVARDARGRIVLQEGEVTGHAHAVLEHDAILYATPGATANAVERWLHVSPDATCQVPVFETRETGRIIVPAAYYDVELAATVQPASYPEVERTQVGIETQAGVQVTHEEHGAIVLPPGDYVVRRQREYAPEAIRLVAD